MNRLPPQQLETIAATMSLGLYGAVKNKTSEQILLAATELEKQRAPPPPSASGFSSDIAPATNMRYPLEYVAIYHGQTIFGRLRVLNANVEHKDFLKDSMAFKNFLRESMSTLVKANIQRSFQFRLEYCSEEFHDNILSLRNCMTVALDRSPTGSNVELMLMVTQDGNGGSSVLLEGYVYKVSVLQQLLTDQRLRLLQMRKLPLVLDLDDTILRAVGDEGVKKVSERDAQSEELRGRVRHLSRRNYTVVLADGLDQFLSWASEKFEISLCSLGEKDYVDAVYEELNKSGPRVVGLAYSARFIYDFYHRHNDFKQPVKDLNTLYAFSYLNDSEVFSLPVIVDDTKEAWTPSAHPNIVEVHQDMSARYWNVDLNNRIRPVLEAIHATFFSQYDKYVAVGPSGRPPSVGMINTRLATNK